MELKLVRKEFNDICTIGRLYIDNAEECWILEDVVRDTKIPGRTAIPYGRYEIILNFSTRFQRIMPLLLKVPNFEGVRIHPGNDANDTDGCLLTGRYKGVNQVTASREAFSLLMLKLKSATEREKIFITIEKG